MTIFPPRPWFLSLLLTVFVSDGWEVAAREGQSTAQKEQSPTTGRFLPPAKESFPGMRGQWDARRVSSRPHADSTVEAAFVAAEANARLAAEGFFRARRYVDGWLAHADPRTGLIPRGLTRSTDVWNAPDAAADNYPFMVLTAAMTDRELFAGRMLEMLRTETRLTSRVGRLPDDYSFSRQGFVQPAPAIGRLIFGASEYAKDGLLPVLEWLGASPWNERMIGLVEDIWAHAPIETPVGRIPSSSFEVNGELLQLLARLHWMTGREDFLDWAVRLGDYYLLGDHHPTRDSAEIRLRDHGCEIVGGLSELYFAVHHRRPEKKRAYKEPLYEMFDTILRLGRNADGLMYNRFNPQTGEPTDQQLADTWGYNLNGFYTVYLVDGHEPYREAVLQALSSIPRYPDYDWERGSADGDADVIEGALNLFNREPAGPAMAWADRQIRIMWSKQHADGVIEGWHGDGNFARTTLMYALWKTQGLRAEPWRPDVRVGAVRVGDRLHVSVAADSAWSGRIRFDRPRHREHLQLPLDYPRINQFPEWYVVAAADKYQILDHASGRTERRDGTELREGVALELASGRETRWTIIRD